MWSGNAGLNSWALQSQKYQNMKHDEVDWTLLAKQWIQLKESNDSAPQTTETLETAELLSMQPPPPPPIPEDTYENTSQTLQPPGDSSTVENISNVGITGSVDMEIEDDKESYTQQYHNNEEWKNWNYNAVGDWENNPNWGYNYQIGHNRLGPTGTSSNLQLGPSSKDQTDQYWGQQNMSSGIMMQKVVEYGHKDRKTFPRSSFQNSNAIESEIDALQRKQLPAWIRDGLEKMERERLKLSEQEQMQKTQKEILQKKREEEEKARKMMNEYDDGNPKPPIKSKFDSDSENNSDVAKEDPHLSSPSKKSIDKRSVSNSVSKEENDDGLDEVLSEDEKLAERMRFIKSSMIEILLDVTNELLIETCMDVFGKAKMKVQQLKKSPGLGMLTSLGGLDIYGDSGAESNGDDAEEGVEDSDEELQQTIKRKRRDFELTERDIYCRLQNEEEEERGDTKPASQNSTPELSDGIVDEIQDSKDSNYVNTEMPENISRGAPQSTNESDSILEESDSGSSSSYAKKKKKKKRKKSRSRRDSSDVSDNRKHKKKKKKYYDRSRSMSRCKKSKSRSLSVRRKVRSKYSRSRSRSIITKRHSRSLSQGDRYRHKRRRRSSSRFNRRSINLMRHVRRHHRSSSRNRRSNSRRRYSRSSSRRIRRSRSVEIRKRSKRRLRS